MESWSYGLIMIYGFKQMNCNCSVINDQLSIFRCHSFQEPLLCERKQVKPNDIKGNSKQTNRAKVMTEKIGA